MFVSFRRPVFVGSNAHVIRIINAGRTFEPKILKIQTIFKTRKRRNCEEKSANLRRINARADRDRR